MTDLVCPQAHLRRQIERSSFSSALERRIRRSRQDRVRAEGGGHWRDCYPGNYALLLPSAPLGGMAGSSLSLFFAFYPRISSQRDCPAFTVRCKESQRPQNVVLTLLPSLQSILTVLRVGKPSPFDQRRTAQLLCLVREHLRVHLQNSQFEDSDDPQVEADGSRSVPLTVETLSTFNPHWHLATVASIFSRHLKGYGYCRKWPIEQTWYSDFLGAAFIFSALRYLRRTEDVKQLSLPETQRSLNGIRTLVGYMAVSLQRIIDIANSPQPGMDTPERSALVKALDVLVYRSGVRID
jgi:hypothetical protein